MATIKQAELLARGRPSRRTAVHWIGGWWLDSGEHLESINPATGEVIGSYAKAVKCFYAYYFAGGYLSETPPGGDINFFGTQISYRF